MKISKLEKKENYMDKPYVKIAILTPFHPLKPVILGQYTVPNLSQKKKGADIELTETQSIILKTLKECGGTEPKSLSEKLQIKPSDLEREIATLRHMEKVKGGAAERKKNNLSLVIWLELNRFGIIIPS